MKRNYLLILLVLPLLFSCSDLVEVKYPDSRDITGLATPVKLNPGTTDIILSDYFNNSDAIDSIGFPNELNGKYNQELGTCIVTPKNENLPYLLEMKVWISGFPYSLLLKKSLQINYTFVFDPGENIYKEVKITGEMNGWNRSISYLKLEEGLWKIDLSLYPGQYQYLLVLDGNEQPDPTNQEKISNNAGGFNSLLQIGDTDDSKLPKLITNMHEENIVAIKIENDINNVFVYWQNYRLADDNLLIENDILMVSIPRNATNFDRSWLRVWADNDFGVSNDILIPLNKGQVVKSAIELTREDWEATVFYFLLVDRFNNGDPSNDNPVDDPEINPKANHFGGDLAGVIQKIKSGYFKELGINTIWLSPIAQNPYEAYGLWPEPRSKFSGYHGYWPISSSKVDDRFGTDDELQELITLAHENNLNVILDYVANHVHELHPVFQQHPDWATDLYLPDGSLNTEKWDEHRLTTWFDTFLPTLDLENPEVSSVMSDSALYWFENFELDGFRHDATKHIPENFQRELTSKIKKRIAIPGNKRIYQIGETYGSPELIGSYVSSGMLDAQFDFNLYDRAVGTFARDEDSFMKLYETLKQSLDQYGSHNLMGYISGNQDRARFISLAGSDVKFEEDHKLAGWTREIGVGDPVSYKKLQSLLAFNMTIPGIPTIYYGDEYGMPGANDPDNRRMMKFGGLEEKEAETFEISKKLVNLRLDYIQFTFGDFKLLYLTDKTFVFARTYFDKSGVVVFNKGIEKSEISFKIPESLNIENLKSNFNNEFTISGNEITIGIEANSFDILTN